MRDRVVLAAILLLALIVRLPGFGWGDDFPGGFRGHHVDEWTHVVLAGTLIDPKIPPRWHPQPYPKGLAAHVAVPFLIQRAATGRLFGAALPSDEALIKTARAISIAYGVLAVGALWWIARRVCTDPRSAHFAGACLALAPLAVTQSHFGLADAPALFWTLAAGACLIADLSDSRRHALGAAGFSVGMAVGLKLTLWLGPALAIAVISRPHRIARSVTAILLTIAGFATCTFLSMSPFDVVKCFTGNSVVPPDALRASDFPLLYAIELLPSFGALTLVIATFGASSALSKSRDAYAIAVALVVPAILHLAVGLPKFAPFPRHLLPLFPLLALAFGVGATRARWSTIVAVIALAYLAYASIGTERRFDHDPRTKVREFLRTRVDPGSRVAWSAYEAEIGADGFIASAFPDGSAPDVIVAEAYRVNHWLSGTKLRDSRPTDHRQVFDGQSALHLTAWQQLFDAKHQPSYRVAETYTVPRPMLEDRIADQILGDRSRTYVGDITIFVKNR